MVMQHFIPTLESGVRGELRVEGRVYKGRTFTVKGKEVELYKVGVLAHALDKTTQTIEMWEKDGDFPHPMYKISGTGLGHCRRWYSKEQIINVQNVWRHFPYRKGHPATRKEFFDTIKAVFYQTGIVTLKIRTKEAADGGQQPATATATETP